MGATMGTITGIIPTSQSSQTDCPTVPQYLEDVYTWAYLDPGNQRLLDRPVVVDVILWGNARRLMRWATAEVAPGTRCLETACVYGTFPVQLAEAVGRDGDLLIVDVAANQIAGAARKLAGHPQVRLRLADCAEPFGEQFNTVVCFFLLHEVPMEYKRRIVDNVLDAVGPGGKAVFVDYHRPHPLHPLKPITGFIFDWLEPFAKDLWHHAIRDFADRPDEFVWTQATLFGGLFQKVVAARK
jgi:SAM-dependent methyltransferase